MVFDVLAQILADTFFSRDSRIGLSKEGALCREKVRLR